MTCIFHSGLLLHVKVMKNKTRLRSCVLAILILLTMPRSWHCRTIVTQSSLQYFGILTFISYLRVEALSIDIRIPRMAHSISLELLQHLTHGGVG
jgi:hypothetical protein